jgi:hypothetical protein
MSAMIVSTLSPSTAHLYDGITTIDEVIRETVIDD